MRDRPNNSAHMSFNTAISPTPTLQRLKAVITENVKLVDEALLNRFITAGQNTGYWVVTQDAQGKPLPAVDSTGAPLPTYRAVMIDRVGKEDYTEFWAEFRRLAAAETSQTTTPPAVKSTGPA